MFGNLKSKLKGLFKKTSTEFEDTIVEEEETTVSEEQVAEETITSVPESGPEPEETPKLTRRERLKAKK
jgi:hypothetical protein